MSFLWWFGPHLSAAVVNEAASDVTSGAAEATLASAAGSSVRVVAQHAPSYVPGEFIVKLKDSVTAAADVLFDAGRPFRAATRDGSASLDRLNARYRVQVIRPLFDGVTRGTGTLVKRRQELASDLDAVKATYAQRTARAPQGAQTPDLSRSYVFEVPASADIAATVAAYAADPHVEYAQPNYVYTVQAQPLPSVAVIPNDPFIEDPANPGFWREGSWGQPYPDLWGLRNIQALEAWNLFPDPLNDPGRGVVVAVIDTGIDRTHPDIAANALPGRDFSTSVFSAIGCVFLHHKSAGGKPIDRNGHGTHVSGTIAAVASNGLGIAGVAPQAMILPLKGIDDSGCGTSSDLANAIVYAANHGADVMNLSWGGLGVDPAIHTAIQQAYGLGVVIVAAAGNDAEDVSEFGFYPAAYAQVVTTSAFDENDIATYFTNFGEKIDVAAPGGGAATPTLAMWNILSLLSAVNIFPIDAVVGDHYLRLGGTSMAAPHVAGLAAVLLSKHPGFSNEEVRQALRIAADEVSGPGFDLYAGYGRINAKRAVQTDQVLTATVDTPDEREVVNLAQSATMTIHGTASGPGFTSFQLFAAPGPEPQQSDFVPITPPASAPVVNNTLGTWTPDRLQFPDGWQTLLLQAGDAQGRLFESRRVVGALYEVPGWPVTDVPIGLLDPFRLPFAGTVAVGNTGTADGNTVFATGFDRGLFSWSSDGRLLSNTSIDTPLLQPPSLGDLDGNGTLEAVVGTRQGLAIMNGRSIRTTPGVCRNGRPVVLDDLNGDGALEIISVDCVGRIYVEDRTGNPVSFQWPQQPVVPANTFPPGVGFGVAASDLATVDLDNTGKKEIVVALSHDGPWPYAVYVLEPDGTARWSHPFGADSNTVAGYPDLVVGDVDGDGWPEIVVYELETPSSGNQVINHWGIFDRHGQIKTEWTSVQDLGELGRIALADLDGDGTLEIITLAGGRGMDPTHPSTVVYAWHYNGDPVAGFPVSLADEVVANPVVADVDGDGIPDIVTSLYLFRSVPSVVTNPVYAWNRSGQLLPGWPRSLIRTDAPGMVAVGQVTTTLTDLDGNGTLDLIASIGGDEIHALDLQVPVAPRALQWPTFRHDFRHTGRFEFPLCGNGVIDPGEECDDGNTRSCDGCSASCRIEHSVCGNGIVEPCEECDDGDGCDSNCTVTACGNGIVTAGEQCDDGNRINTDSCKNDCTPNVCGDGVIQPGVEECDDGNLIDGDGCSSSCQGEWIPGNGPAKATCNQEWLTVPVPPRARSGVPTNRLVCTDDDPTCDFGASTGDAGCTFHVAMCFNMTDGRIKTATGSPACRPTGIASVQVRRPDPNRPRDDADRANGAALRAALTGLGGDDLGGICRVPPNGQGCMTNSDCDDPPGRGNGVCRLSGVVSFQELTTANVCTSFADIRVPLSGARGSRTLRLVTAPYPDFKLHANTLTLVCKRR